MSELTLLKVIGAAIFSLFLSWVVFSRFDNEIGTENQDSEFQRYVPYIPGSLLPLYLAMLLILLIPVHGLRYALETMVSMSFGIFLHISIFYGLLFFLMPFLRKFISSRACAMLWIIPNYLYITQQRGLENSHPLLVLQIPGNLLWWLLGLWVSGFLFVLGKALWEHHVFRRTILKDSFAITDLRVRLAWEAELEKARINKPKFKLVTSPNVRTPLSIGFFQRTIVVVLPEKQYTDTELEMIFRHEIIHICRADSENKFFLVFCCAVFWFNPLMWIARRKASDDLELSCDETVLLDSNEDQRKQYADLILNTAGDERGFTTCLSATASALRYRLRNIVKPARRSSGAVVIGICFFILCSTTGYAALSYEEYTGQQVIYQNDVPYIDPAYAITGIGTTLLDQKGFIKCRDEDALEQYLASIKLSKLLGNYSMDGEEERLFLIYNSPSGRFALALRERFLTITPLGRTMPREAHYAIRSEVDWEYLASLLETYHIQHPELPFPPVLDLMTNEGIWNCPGKVVSYICDGEKQKRESWWQMDPELILWDLEEDSIRLSFLHDVSGDYVVIVTDLQDNLIREYTSPELKKGYELPLEKKPARYRILASFEDEASRIEMEYSFTVKYSVPE